MNRKLAERFGPPPPPPAPRKAERLERLAALARRLAAACAEDPARLGAPGAARRRPRRGHRRAHPRRLTAPARRARDAEAVRGAAGYVASRAAEFRGSGLVVPSTTRNALEPERAPPRKPLLFLLREGAARGPQAHRRADGLHLRRVHPALQRHHRRGGGARRRPPRGVAADARGDQELPRRLRRRAGQGEEGPLRRRLQPLQARLLEEARAAAAARPGALRATRTSSCRSRTSSSSGRPAPARRSSPSRSRAS